MGGKSDTTIIAQVTSILRTPIIKDIAKATRADRYYKTLFAMDHLIVSVYIQAVGGDSLRDAETSLSTGEGKAKALGLRSGVPCRSTLAYANEHRTPEFFEKALEAVLDKCRPHLDRGVDDIFKFKNDVYCLDSSTISLCLSMFPWAEHRTAMGGVKIHTLMEHRSCMPSLVMITPAKVSDIKAAKTMEFSKGSIVLMDRAYVDYEFFKTLTDGGVFFVTRSKKNMACEVVESHEIPRPGPGRPPGKQASSEEAAEEKRRADTLEAIKAANGIEKLKVLERHNLLHASRVISAVEAMELSEALTVIKYLEQIWEHLVYLDERSRKRKAAKEAKRLLAEARSGKLRAPSGPQEPSGQQGPQEPDGRQEPQEPSGRKEPQNAQNGSKSRRRRAKPHRKDQNGQIKGLKDARRAKVNKLRAHELRDRTSNIPKFVVLKDEEIRLTNVVERQKRQKPGSKAHQQASQVRRVTVLYYDQRNRKPRMMEFLTNNRTLAANTVARLYAERWRIETFFKTIKQNLQIKSFLGTSENAVHIQLFSAMIALCLLSNAHCKANNAKDYCFSTFRFCTIVSGFSYISLNVFMPSNSEDRAPPRGLFDCVKQ
jgi:hypothetical protein